MTEHATRLPKPEVRGVGTVMYRCAGCGQVSPPDTQTIVEGRSYHPEHLPKEGKHNGG